MSNHKYNQNLLIGAAVAAGILGTLTGLLGFKKSGKRLSEQAKEIANQVLETGEVLNKKMVLGGVAGGLVGAAAALLLAPKSGADFIKDIARPFSQEIASARSHKPASHKKKSASVSTKSRPKHKTAAKAAEKKTNKTAATKKSHARRRTAIAKLPKAAAAVHDKVVHEVKEA